MHFSRWTGREGFGSLMTGKRIRTDCEVRTRAASRRHNYIYVSMAPFICFRGKSAGIHRRTRAISIALQRSGSARSDRRTSAKSAFRLLRDEPNHLSAVFECYVKCEEQEHSIRLTKS